MKAAFAINEKESYLMTSYQRHLVRKEQSRQPKTSDKRCAIENPNSIRSIIFDLQKVLQAPLMKISNLYYSRKLSTYNFSTYVMASKAAIWYMWHEGLAKRGRIKLHHLFMTVVLILWAMAHWRAIGHFALGHKAI